VILVLLLITLNLSLGNPPIEYRILKKFKETQDIGAALFLLENYPSAVFRDELRVELAYLFFKRGEKERARRILRNADLFKIREEYANVISSMWKELSLPYKPFVLRFPELAVDLIPEVSLSEREKETVLKRLLSKGLLEEVVKLAEDLCFYKGKALYMLKRYEESLKTLKKCNDERADVYVLLSYLKMKDLNSAELFVLKRNKEDLYFRLGWLFLVAGDYKRAKKYISLSGNNYRRFFYSGLIEFIQKRFLLAYENFSLSEKYTLGNAQKAQVYFWKYKTLKALGKDDLALSYLEKCSELFGFYAAVARRYLGKKVYKKPSLSFKEVKESSFFKRLKDIRNLGFAYYMRLEAFEKAHKLKPEDILRLLRIDPYTAIKLAVRVFGAGSDIYISVAFPTPFKAVVKKASARYNVPQELIYAVMRQESLFDPFAVSRSGAKGLMQLMDKTAKWKAERIGYDLRDIFDIETNIILGTAYLRFLLDLWKGDLVRAIASYNAGQGVVSRWKNYNDDFVFIETIPYDETRTYVKRVLWFYYVYVEKLSLR